MCVVVIFNGAKSEIKTYYICMIKLLFMASTIGGENNALLLLVFVDRQYFFYKNGTFHINIHCNINDMYIFYNQG